MAPYSIVWLLNEIAYSAEEVRVYTVGSRCEFPFRLPVAWRHIPISDLSHCRVVQLAEQEIAPAPGDVMVLVQLTQPLREHGLLERAVSCVRHGADSCLTAAEMPSCSWRALRADGSHSASTTATEHLVDGQLSAWRPGHAEDTFRPELPHAVIRTEHRWGLIDINEESDLPPGLDAMAGRLLCAPMNQPPLRLRGRKVLLIGSGQDLVGRGLGARIDAGEWDVVVRCNHFYGDPVDVGTRTDVAVVRLAVLEQAFFEEAPEPPRRVVSTNDAQNFPISLLQQAAEEVGHREASCGVIAALWLLRCGARLSVVGMGHLPDGSWAKQKVYPDGRVDHATFCDWEKEHAWWERQRDIQLL